MIKSLTNKNEKYKAFLKTTAAEVKCKTKLSIEDMTAFFRRFLYKYCIKEKLAQVLAQNKI